MPVVLHGDRGNIESGALLDTGADANILPYHLGLEPGLAWNDSPIVIGVSGNLGQAESRAVIVLITIDSFASKRFVFIWSKSEMARLLLGQLNFFQEFNVCFFCIAGLF